MDYKTFADEVKDRVAEYCGPEYKVTLTQALKNNSVKLTGIAILKKGSKITPTIYLEDFYTDYCDGMDMEEIVRQIVRIYDTNRCPQNLDLEMFEDFEKVKDRIVYRIVNYEKNQELLEKAPHRRFLDLAVIYSISLGEIPGLCASVTVYQQYLARWGVTEEELWEAARMNTPRISEAQIVSMGELLKDMNGVDDEDVLDLKEAGPPMYVLTNKRRVNGAACLLYEKVVGDFARKIKKNFFILPSSIHEVILLAEESGYDPKSLRAMVREVNETQVGEQEILSDSLYYYSYENEEMSIAV